MNHNNLLRIATIGNTEILTDDPEVKVKLLEDKYLLSQCIKDIGRKHKDLHTSPLNQTILLMGIEPENFQN